jgi:hypothetical protein
MSKKKYKSLTIQFMSYEELSGLSISEKIKKLLKLVIENNLILLQGKLRPEEESRLIEDTMVLVGTLKNFKGIELAVLSSKDKNVSIGGAMKTRLAKFLGVENAITIIGPAMIVREIKKDPSKIQLLLEK